MQIQRFNLLPNIVLILGAKRPQTDSLSSCVCGKNGRKKARPPRACSHSIHERFQPDTPKCIPPICSYNTTTHSIFFIPKTPFSFRISLSYTTFRTLSRHPEGSYVTVSKQFYSCSRLICRIGAGPGASNPRKRFCIQTRLCHCSNLYPRLGSKPTCS